MFWNKKKTDETESMRRIRNLHRTQKIVAQDLNRPIEIGIFNGLEIALAILEDRKPKMMEAGK